MLEDNILEQAEFKKYAKRNLVYYIADFSDREDGEEWKEDHAELMEKFPVKGFPRTYIISPQGEKLGVIGGADEDWGLKDFIDKIEGFRNK